MPTDKIKVQKKTHVKIVVRRLPHGITQEELLQQLDPIPEHKLFCFRKADMNLIPFAFSRAYFVFPREEDAIAFVDRFNGYVFVDKLGHESSAIVELAPCPEIVENKRSAKENDKRVNTIEEDTEYIQFLKEYNNAVSKKPSSVDELLSELEEKQKRLKEAFVQSTPLTDFVLQKNWLKERKQDRRQSTRLNRATKEKEVALKKETTKKAKKENKKEHLKKEKTEEVKKEARRSQERSIGEDKKESSKKVFTSIIKNSKKPMEDAEGCEGDHVEGPAKPKTFEEHHDEDSSKPVDNGSEKKFRPFKIASKNRGVLHKTDQPTSSHVSVEGDNRQGEQGETHDRKTKEKNSASEETPDRTPTNRNKKPERAIYKPPSHRTRTKQFDKNIPDSQNTQKKDENVD